MEGEDRRCLSRELSETLCQGSVMKQLRCAWIQQTILLFSVISDIELNFPLQCEPSEKAITLHVDSSTLRLTLVGFLENYFDEK